MENKFTNKDEDGKAFLNPVLSHLYLGKKIVLHVLLLRACLVVILESVYNTFTTWKFLSFMC